TGSPSTRALVGLCGAPDTKVPEAWRYSIRAVPEQRLDSTQASQITKTFPAFLALAVPHAIPRHSDRQLKSLTNAGPPRSNRPTHRDESSVARSPLCPKSNGR